MKWANIEKKPNEECEPGESKLVVGPNTVDTGQPDVILVHKKKISWKKNIYLHKWGLIDILSSNNGLW